ncbi:MAG: hypothetical protein PQJ59_11965 [Spirochaetales bacterium]|nr:hypothetical protein [Spirochaetales bacterium]
MERYLQDLKIKWQTSLDLLAEEVGAPYGVFLRALSDGWELFAANSESPASFPSGGQCRGELSERDLNELIGNGTYCRTIDPSLINKKILPYIEETGVSHYCGFSVVHEEELFGLLFLVGNSPFKWNQKSELFLRRFKTLLEEDLQALSDKARYCDELTRSRLASQATGYEADKSSRDPLAAILDFAGREEIHRATTPVLPLMDDIHRSHEPYMPTGVKLVTRIRCPYDYSLYTDGSCLKQILSGLLVQAENHTWQGDVKIECRLDEIHGLFLFIVSDKGKGITWDNWSRELSESRTLASKLGGRLSVHTCEEKGNNYTLSLPLDHHVRATA